MTRRLPIAVILLALALQTAFVHLRGVYTYPDDETWLHRAIIDGTAEPPFRYRILIPALAEVVSAGIPAGASERVILAHDLIALVCIVGFTFTLYGWLARLYPPVYALLGVALVGMASTVATIRPHMLAHSWAEAWLLVAALWVLHRWMGEAEKRSTMVVLNERI